MWAVHCVWGLGRAVQLRRVDAIGLHQLNERAEAPEGVGLAHVEQEGGGEEVEGLAVADGRVAVGVPVGKVVTQVGCGYIGWDVVT